MEPEAKTIRILSCPLDAFYTEISTWKVRKISCGAKRKEKKGKEKKKGKTVYKISESEPSEREARETCERMRKMASSQKVPAPALVYLTNFYLMTYF